ncbi:MAG TPA: nuclear transport factor 2 family protein [Candidatus Sulfotelmatobacter sp.]|nr:nuclear transport factor 2 family protein [Candidatus Sulfotelmatobacter sp.]
MITRVVWLFLLALVTTTTAALARQQVVTRPRGVSAGADQQIIREVIEMERQSKEATLHRDADFTRRTLADDYVAITPLGQVTTKDDAIAARKSGQLRYEAMNISEMVVRIYGDTAVVTARAEVRGHQLGEDFSGPYRYTRIWVRHNGHWQTVSYQATVTQ